MLRFLCGCSVECHFVTHNLLVVGGVQRVVIIDGMLFILLGWAALHVYKHDLMKEEMQM